MALPILVIDDDPDHRRLLEYVLTLADDDLAVTAVATIDEAVQSIQRETFACIVLEFNLGMIDVSDTIPELRRH
ncbi:MAG: response regulator, partial [Planctomycetota bacterium]